MGVILLGTNDLLLDMMKGIRKDLKCYDLQCRSWVWRVLDGNG